MIEKLHIYITIAAALAVDAACLIISSSLIETAICLIATIVVFYFIGLFIRNFFMKALNNENNEDNEKQKSANDKDIENNMEDSNQTSDNLQESNI